MFEAANLLLTKLVTQELGGVPVEYDDTTGTIGNELVSFIDSTTGAQALGMANAREGQLKLIYMLTDGGNSVVTPSAFISSTITFDDAADLWLGVFLNGEWKTIYATATVA